MPPPPKPPMPRALQAALARAATPKAISQPGALVGRYRVIEELGRGGHGAVFRAVDTQSGAAVALKVLHQHVSSDQLRMRMKREAYAMSQLSGTCAAQVFECSETPQGQLYLAMELLEGRDLKAEIDAHETGGARMPLPVLRTLLDPIVTTLQTAHERGIIHRDLKPENCFVLKSGGVRLVDFGLMKDHSLAQLTEVGTIAGSPAYIAPEAWAGIPDRVDHRIDVYSLGVMIFRMLAGVRPFEPGEHLLDFIVLVGRAPRPSLHRLRPDLSPAVDAWTGRALAADRDQRFSTVRELWVALWAALGVR